MKQSLQSHQIIELLKKYNIKIEFEKVHNNRERNIIVRKQQL